MLSQVGRDRIAPGAALAGVRKPTDGLRCEVRLRHVWSPRHRQERIRRPPVSRGSSERQLLFDGGIGELGFAVPIGAKEINFPAKDAKLLRLRSQRL